MEKKSRIKTLWNLIKACACVAAAILVAKSIMDKRRRDSEKVPLTISTGKNHDDRKAYMDDGE